MKVRETVKPLVFTENEGELRIAYSNRGEPFRDGVEFQFDKLNGRTSPTYVLLDVRLAGRTSCWTYVKFDS